MSNDVTQTDNSEMELAIPAVPGSEQDAKCYAFMGVGGGVGTTSLCVQLAYDIMKTVRMNGDIPARVCLLDLDFETGALASYLDIQAGVKADQMSGEPERIDAALTSAFITKHPCGLRLLSTPNSFGGNNRVSAECVLALMDAANQMYDFLILDVPRIWSPWTHAAMAAADQFHLVTDMTIPGLHQTRSRISDLEQQAELQSGISLIVNKFERRSLKTSLTPADAQKALRRDIDHYVCVDTQTTTDALNCGEPAGRLKPDARFVKDVSEISQALANTGKSRSGAVKMKSKKRGLFARGAA